MQGTDVYEVDFSSLTAEGIYALRMTTFGSSYPFRVANDVLHRQLTISAHATYYQRRGVALSGTFLGYNNTRPPALKAKTAGGPVDMYWTDASLLYSGNSDLDGKNDEVIPSTIPEVPIIFPTVIAPGSTRSPKFNGVIIAVSSYNQPFPADGIATGAVKGRVTQFDDTGSITAQEIISPVGTFPLHSVYSLLRYFDISIISCLAKRCWTVGWSFTRFNTIPLRRASWLT